MTFHERLRAATDRAHREAEASDFVGRLLDGSLDRAAYRDLLVQYEAIYAALEASYAEVAAAPRYAALYDPRLPRLAAIRHDLDRLDPSPGAERAVVPAARDYAERIAGLWPGQPARHVAHHYLRYLGDLSGGQAIGRLVARHYAIPAEAMTMWQFALDAKLKPYKDAYRERLNELALDEAEEAAFVDEAVATYRRNRDMFGQLAERAERRAAGGRAETRP